MGWVFHEWEASVSYIHACTFTSDSEGLHHWLVKVVDKNYFSGACPSLCLLVKDAAFAVKCICVFFLHEYILLQTAQMLLTPICSRFLITYSLVTQSNPEILAITHKIFKPWISMKQLKLILRVDLRGKSLIVEKNQQRARRTVHTMKNYA